MDKDNKLCILCCRSFLINDRTQNVEKISQFCEDVCTNIYKDGKDSLKISKDILELDKHFGMSVCVPCCTEINELLTSKEQTTLLEHHVLLLQKEILKGLRDLDNCLEKTKCHREKIRNTVKGSEEFNLRKRLPKEQISSCFVFNLRRCITNDQFKEGRLIGNLSIPESEQAQSKPTVKIEQETTSYSEDEDLSNSLGDFNDDDDYTCSDRDLPAIKIEKDGKSPTSTSRMTLRTRSSKKAFEDAEIRNPKLVSIRRPPLNRKKKKIIKKPLKPFPKKKQPPRPKMVRHCSLCLSTPKRNLPTNSIFENMKQSP